MGRDLDALLRFIEARQATAFDWAQPFDCVSYAMAAVEAQCGWNPARGLKWTSRRGALRVIERLGGLRTAMDARMTPVAPARAMRGDIAGIYDDLLGVSLMVVEGETLVGPGERGNKRLRRSEMICAWSAERPLV